MVIKLETSEGFHTKSMSCDHIQTHPEVSETFVPSMSSLVTEVGIHTDYEQLASAIALPL